MSIFHCGNSSLFAEWEKYEVGWLDRECEGGIFMFPFNL